MALVEESAHPTILASATARAGSGSPRRSRYRWPERRPSRRRRRTVATIGCRRRTGCVASRRPSPRGQPPSLRSERKEAVKMTRRSPHDVSLLVRSLLPQRTLGRQGRSSQTRVHGPWRQASGLAVSLRLTGVRRRYPRARSREATAGASLSEVLRCSRLCPDAHAGRRVVDRFGFFGGRDDANATPRSTQLWSLRSVLRPAALTKTNPFIGLPVKSIWRAPG